ncbi:MAG: GntR family transcriptional regulator [Rhodoplanes sp.]|nr:GntR family transcriptional regulator [Rhodoplanes sp.]
MNRLASMDQRAPEKSGDMVLATSEKRGPIVRQTLHEAVVTRVRDMIIEGTLPSGTRINESNLVHELGVSRTPLREALKCLASEGLIELSPGRGAVVRQFTRKDIHDSLVVIGDLEALAGRLACAQATDQQIREVRDLHDRMIDMYNKRTRLTYFKLNQAIHTKIVAISGNDALAYVHGIMQARIRRIRYLGHEGSENWAAAVADHEEIIAGLEARNAERLGRALTAHMESAWDRVRAAV